MGEGSRKSILWRGTLTKRHKKWVPDFAEFSILHDSQIEWIVPIILSWKEYNSVEIDKSQFWIDLP